MQSAVGYHISSFSSFDCLKMKDQSSSFSSFYSSPCRLLYDISNQWCRLSNRLIDGDGVGRWGEKKKMTEKDTVSFFIM